MGNKKVNDSCKGCINYFPGMSGKCGKCLVKKQAWENYLKELMKGVFENEEKEKNACQGHNCFLCKWFNLTNKEYPCCDCKHSHVGKNFICFFEKR
jgi:hypothetical protein